MQSVYESAAINAAMVAAVPPEDILAEDHGCANEILRSLSQFVDDDDLDLWIDCADKVYTIIFGADGGVVPSTTDVVEAAARCVPEDTLQDMLERSLDAPVCLEDWIKNIPGLQYVDSDGGDVQEGHRLGQLTNAVWASEAPDGYRYWPGCENNDSMDFLVDLFCDHYHAADPDEDKIATVKRALDDTYLGDTLELEDV